MRGAREDWIVAAEDIAGSADEFEVRDRRLAAVHLVHCLIVEGVVCDGLFASGSFLDPDVEIRRRAAVSGASDGLACIQRQRTHRSRFFDADAVGVVVAPLHGIAEFQPVGVWLGYIDGRLGPDALGVVGLPGIGSDIHCEARGSGHGDWLAEPDPGGNGLAQLVGLAQRGPRCDTNILDERRAVHPPVDLVLRQPYGRAQNSGQGVLPAHIADMRARGHGQRVRRCVEAVGIHVGLLDDVAEVMVSSVDAHSAVCGLAGVAPYEHPEGRGTGDAHGLAELHSNLDLFAAVVRVSARRLRSHMDASNRRSAADAPVHLVGGSVFYGVEAERGNCVVPPRAADGRLISQGERAGLYADAVRVHVGRLHGVGEVQRVRALLDLVVIRLPRIASYLERKLRRTLHGDILGNIRAERHSDDHTLAGGVGIALLRRADERHSGHDRARAGDSHVEHHGVRIPVDEVVVANSAGRHPSTVLHRNGVLLQRSLLRGGSGYDACRAVHGQTAGQRRGNAPGERRIAPWGCERDGAWRPRNGVRDRRRLRAEVRPQPRLRSVQLRVGLVHEGEARQVDRGVLPACVPERASIEFEGVCGDAHAVGVQVAGLHVMGEGDPASRSVRIRRENIAVARVDLQRKAHPAGARRRRRSKDDRLIVVYRYRDMRRPGIRAVLIGRRDDAHRSDNRRRGYLVRGDIRDRVGAEGEQGVCAAAVAERAAIEVQRVRGNVPFRIQGVHDANAVGVIVRRLNGVHEPNRAVGRHGSSSNHMIEAGAAGLVSDAKRERRTAGQDDVFREPDGDVHSFAGGVRIRWGEPSVEEGDGRHRRGVVRTAVDLVRGVIDDGVAAQSQGRIRAGGRIPGFQSAAAYRPAVQGQRPGIDGYAVVVLVPRLHPIDESEIVPRSAERIASISRVVYQRRIHADVERKLRSAAHLHLLVELHFDYHIVLRVGVIGVPHAGSAPEEHVDDLGGVCGGDGDGHGYLRAVAVDVRHRPCV